MEALSTYELVEFSSLMRTSWDLQFQYWLALTFAMVVARFSFAQVFSTKWRLALTSMYFAACVLFMGRFYIDSFLGAAYRDAALDRGAFWPELGLFPDFLFWLRWSLFVAGTIVTTYLIARENTSED